MPERFPRAGNTRRTSETWALPMLMEMLPSVFQSAPLSLNITPCSNNHPPPPLSLARRSSWLWRIPRGNLTVAWRRMKSSRRSPICSEARKICWLSLASFFQMPNDLWYVTIPTASLSPPTVETFPRHWRVRNLPHTFARCVRFQGEIKTLFSNDTTPFPFCLQLTDSLCRYPNVRISLFCLTWNTLDSFDVDFVVR